MRKIAAISVLGLILCSASFASKTSVSENPYGMDQIANALASGFVNHNDGFYIGGSTMFNTANVANGNNKPLTIDHIGFNINSGNDFKVGPNLDVGLGVQYSKFGNIDAKAANVAKKYTFNNISLIGSMRYNLTQKLSISADLGYGRTFGRNIKRWTPLFGTSANYMLGSSVALNIAYQHYVGTSSRKALTTNKATPDFDIVGLGIKNYF